MPLAEGTRLFDEPVRCCRAANSGPALQNQRSRTTDPCRFRRKQVSPMRMKITLLIAGLAPDRRGLFLQSKGFFG